MKLVSAFTTQFWYCFADATRLSNEFTKCDKEYFTAIKGKPLHSSIPHECWAVTNRFDPRAIKVEDKE